MKAVTVTLEKEKQAIELKYLISISAQQKIPQKQIQLISALNKLYPFTQYPLSSAPPVQLFETKEEEKILSTKITEELSNYSFIVVTGGLKIVKGQHQFIQNRFLSKQTEDQIFFNIHQEGVILKAVSNSCYIRIHNIWVNMAKRRSKESTEDFVKKKLLNIPFFANLEFQEFNKVCKSAYVKILGPGDYLLKNGEVPYNMYIVAEGQLVFQRKIKMLNDKQLWIDVINELQRQQDDTCQLMFRHLVKNPKESDEIFEVIFKLKNINENEIICGKETLFEEKVTYDILSSLKTKLICIKYPDFYLMSSDKLAQIRSWPFFEKDNIQLRKDYYYQLKWKDFKEEVKRQSHNFKLQRQKFEDFLRKAVQLGQQKYYYFPNKVGEGVIADSPASRVQKLKFLSYISK